MQNFDASGVGAGLVELSDIGLIELEARRLHDLLHLFHLRGAGDRRGESRARDQPGQRDLGRRGAFAAPATASSAARIRRPRSSSTSSCARRAGSCRDPLQTGTCRSESRWPARSRE